SASSTRGIPLTSPTGVVVVGLRTGLFSGGTTTSSPFAVTSVTGCGVRLVICTWLPFVWLLGLAVWCGGRCALLDPQYAKPFERSQPRASVFAQGCYHGGMRRTRPTTLTEEARRAL